MPFTRQFLSYEAGVPVKSALRRRQWKRAMGRLLLVETLFPIVILRIARAKRKDRVGQAIALTRTHAHHQGAVVAALDTPYVTVE